MSGRPIKRTLREHVGLRQRGFFTVRALSTRVLRRSNVGPNCSM